MVITQRKGPNPVWGGRRELGKELELNLKKHTGWPGERLGSEPQTEGAVWANVGMCLEGRRLWAGPGPGRKDNAGPLGQNC